MPLAPDGWENIDAILDAWQAVEKNSFLGKFHDEIS